MRAAKVALGLVAALAIAVALLTLTAATDEKPWDEADAALVLSGDVDYLRVKHAAQLYKQKKVKAILLTGAGVGGDSATAMRDIALINRVPADAIVVETASTTTRENLVQASPLVARKGWRRVALVTSASHMPRALAAARKAMPEVEWLPSVVPDAGPAARARKLRVEEALKRAYYVVRGWA